jgi:cytochrome c oxidase subunit 4
MKRIALYWLALLALMFISLGSSYVSLGGWNAAIGVAIAGLKASLVAAVFMRLSRGPALLRLVAATAIAMWLLLVGLSGVDYATRPNDPAPVQPALAR